MDWKSMTFQGQVGLMLMFNDRLLWLSRFEMLSIRYFSSSLLAKMKH